MVKRVIINAPVNDHMKIDPCFTVSDLSSGIIGGLFIDNEVLKD
jgi:hypothetical protein